MRTRGLSLLFDIAMIFFALVSLPRFWKKSAQAKNPSKMWRGRLGKLEADAVKRSPGRPLVWVHAVSVGEVAAIRLLVERLRPDFSILLSTVTPTGQQMAESLGSQDCTVIYFPFDLSFIVRRVLKQIQPDLILLAETEIWPNFVLEAKKLGISMGIINGRISEKSFRGYRKSLGLLTPVFQSLDFLLVQTEEDCQRYAHLGIENSRIHVLGNMKFDQIEAQEPETHFKTQLGYEASDQIWIGASTHPGEEALILDAFQSLKNDFANLRLLLVPRHPERARVVGEEARRRDFRPIYFSSRGEKLNPDEVLIIDKIGQLKRLYSVADLVVMGGSFIPHGGQNPIEPALAERAVLSGPHVSNFRAVYDLFAKENAVRMVSGGRLCEAVRELLKEPGLREILGKNAKRVVLTQRGATDRHLAWVKNFLEVPEPCERL